ncbi:hypothetical protein QQZ08_010681 [Neonectria magnoliae]|uniref:Uncharacterized protein n=1 Tax=Neonectria magnoliae TaxID=2732573 RepID=A0ABR1HF86_9HYPO
MHKQAAYAGTILEKHPELINIPDKLKKTALHYAVESSSGDMVRLLLENGADVNVHDKDDNTPLHIAILRHDNFICDILMEPRFGVKVLATDLERAWNLAVDAGAGFVIKLLQNLRSKSSKLLTAGDPHTSSALTYSKRGLALILANDNSPEFTEADLAFLLELSRKSETSGDTPLSVDQSDVAATIRAAILKGAGNVAAFLLRRYPIDLQSLDQDEGSIIHLAVVYDAQSVVKLLLDSAGFLATNSTDQAAQRFITQSCSKTLM